MMKRVKLQLLRTIDMTRVDFYILDNSRLTARAEFLCRLAEKIMKSGHNIYIHTDTPQHAENLDQLLWTFRQGSFLPHARTGTKEASSSPILIGTNQQTELHDVLINFGKDVPGFFSQFKRIAEVINKQDESRVSGRSRYKFYKERGYETQSHDIV